MTKSRVSRRVFLAGASVLILPLVIARTAGRATPDKPAVSAAEFGSAGDGETDDTAALAAALATGKDLHLPAGSTYAVSNLTGFVNNQRIFGGGRLVKFGAAKEPMVLLPDEAEGIWFDGIEFDGRRDRFKFGDPAMAILGYLTKSLKVTNCYFHDIIDCGIKLRDGANLYASNNRFISVMENGIELHNYTVDVRTGRPYTGERPAIHGNHIIIDNYFAGITRFENPDGPLVDACGVGIFGATGYRQKNIRVERNKFVDCLRCIWTENNDVNSETDRLIITGNSLEGGIKGGPRQGVFGKVGIGIVAGKNVVISKNTIKNIANHNPRGTETAGIAVSGSARFSESENVAIFENSIIDDTLDRDRTEYGVHVLIGTDIRVYDNVIEGVSVAPVYIHPSYVRRPSVHGNRGLTENI